MTRIRQITLFAFRVQVALTSGRQITIIGVEVRIPSAQAPSARIMSATRILYLASLSTRNCEEGGIIVANARVHFESSNSYRVLRVL